MYFSDFIMQIFNELIALIIGLYFLMFAVTFFRKEKRKAREMNERRYTFEFCMAESKVISKLSKNLSNGITIENENVLLILGEFEKIAVGVYSGVLSAEVILLYYGALMQNFYKDNRLILFEIREAKEDAMLYANYERLMEERNVDEIIRRINKCNHRITK